MNEAVPGGGLLLDLRAGRRRGQQRSLGAQSAAVAPRYPPAERPRPALRAALRNCFIHL